MKSKTIAIMLLLLSGCGQPYNYQTPEEKISQQCTEAGYIDKEFDDCISSATKAYKIEAARQEKEFAKARKQAEKQRLAALKAIHDADKEKCSGYGFKNGTDKFAACMQNIENSRNLAELQSERLQQAQYQASETQRQLDNIQRQAAINNIISSLSPPPQPQVIYAPPAPSMPVTTSCRRDAWGVNCTSW